MAEAFVRVSTVKKYVKGRLEGLRIGEDAVDAIDKKVQALLDEAIKHAVADKRKTIKERDIA